MLYSKESWFVSRKYRPVTWVREQNTASKGKTPKQAILFGAGLNPARNP